MKIFFTFDNTTTVGGGSAIYNAIIANKDEKILLICPPGDLAYKCKEFATVYTFHKRSSLLASAIRLRRVLKKVPKRTEVNVHGISTMPLVFLSTLGLKVIRTFTEHLLTDRYKLEGRFNDFRQKLAYFFLIRTYKHVYCVSEAVQTFVSKKFLVPKWKTSVIYNTVPEIVHEPIKHTTRKVVRLITVGSLTRIKNIETLLDSLVLLNNLYKLEVIGEGSERENLRDYAKKLGVSDNVSFLGNIPHGEVLNKLLNSDIYIQTSLTESFGYAIAEAMSVGLPIVAFSVGGIPELVEDKVSGFLVKPYSVKGITKAISKLSKDHKLRSKLGKSGFESLEKFPRVAAYID